MRLRVVSARQQQYTSASRVVRLGRDLNCWDGIGICTLSIDPLSALVADGWVVPTEFVDAVLEAGLGDTASPDERSVWHAT